MKNLLRLFIIPIVLLTGSGLAQETAGKAPGAIANYIFIPLALIMLVLSLRQRETV